MEIVHKAVNKPRLTIARDRVTLKIPLDFPVLEEGQLIELARRRIEELGQVTKTYRTSLSLKRDGNHE